MKLCKHCQQTKPLEAFYLNTGYLCKACTSTIRRTHYAANREKCLAHQNAYYATHREECRARAKIQLHSRPAAMQKNKERAAAWYKKHPEQCKARSRQHHLKKSYGLSPADYEKMLTQQNNKCALCGKDASTVLNKRLGVDHDHKTGAVRALLCNACNCALGFMEDNSALLRNAADYVDKYRGEY